MTTTKAIFARATTLCLLLQAGALALIGLPALEPQRAFLISQLRLEPYGLWIILSIFLLLVSVVALCRLDKKAGEPLRDLSHQAQAGAPNSLRHLSHCREEQILRDFIQQLSTRNSAHAERVSELEEELSKTADERDASLAKQAETETLLKDFARIRQELSIEKASLAAANQTLEQSLQLERRAKVGVEVERRSEEIYQQMERAISAAALRSIWLPNFVAELRTPITIIQGLARRMETHWDDTSLAHHHESLREILHQSEAQLKRLDETMSRIELQKVDSAPTTNSESEFETGEKPHLAASPTA